MAPIRASGDASARTSSLDMSGFLSARGFAEPSMVNGTGANRHGPRLPSRDREGESSSGQGSPDAVGAGHGEDDADHDEEGVGGDLLGDVAAERRRGDAADQQAHGHPAEVEEAQGEDEGRRDGHGDEEFGRADGADYLPGIGALDQQVAGHDRAPAAAAG